MESVRLYALGVLVKRHPYWCRGVPTQNPEDLDDLAQKSVVQPSYHDLFS